MKAPTTLELYSLLGSLTGFIRVADLTTLYDLRRRTELLKQVDTLFPPTQEIKDADPLQSNSNSPTSGDPTLPPSGQSELQPRYWSDVLPEFACDNWSGVLSQLPDTTTKH